MGRFVVGMLDESLFTRGEGGVSGKGAERGVGWGRGKFGLT